MKTLLQSTILSSTAAALLIGSMAQPVFAGETYAGAACQHVSGVKPRYKDGAIYNISTSRAMRVVCPMASAHNAGTRDAWVKVTDRANGNNDIRCELFTVYESDGSSSPTSWRSGVVRSSGFGSGVQRLDFDTSSFNEGALTYSGAHSYINCSLPPRTANGPAEIHSYALVQ